MVCTNFCFISCSEPQKIIKANPTTYAEPADGSSYEKAIVINEKTETKGVQTEYKWLSEKYPGYTFVSHKLMTYNEQLYDIITIKTRKGEKQELYFEILSFSGKF
ncbi:MAG: hypothetical protein SGJ10_12455 [Bacteroidota bacterium]|nr:hypothetical protein [Bacteroidota bacterium]